jgi:hypothetical protein
MEGRRRRNSGTNEDLLPQNAEGKYVPVVRSQGSKTFDDAAKALERTVLLGRIRAAGRMAVTRFPSFVTS